MKTHDFPTFFDHMARLQQILAHHSYIVVLICAFVAYIPWLQCRRMMMIGMPRKRKRILLRDLLKIKKNIRMLVDCSGLCSILAVYLRADICDARSNDASKHD